MVRAARQNKVRPGKRNQNLAAGGEVNRQGATEARRVASNSRGRPGQRSQDAAAADGDADTDQIREPEDRQGLSIAVSERVEQALKKHAERQL